MLGVDVHCLAMAIMAHRSGACSLCLGVRFDSSEIPEPEVVSGGPGTWSQIQENSKMGDQL